MEAERGKPFLKNMQKRTRDRQDDGRLVVRCSMDLVRSRYSLDVYGLWRCEFHPRLRRCDGVSITARKGLSTMSKGAPGQSIVLPQGHLFTAAIIPAPANWRDRQNKHTVLWRGF